MKYIKLFLLTIIMLTACRSGNESTKKSDVIVFKEDWESLKNHHTPSWFRDAKFGIYTHWGPLTIGSTISGSTFYGNRMYRQEERWIKFFNLHRETFGDQNEVGYKDIIKMFNPVKFDASEWAELFYQAGARFAGPVAIHHDNFAMWKSDITRWNAYNITGIDIVGELEREIRKRGMKFITTFHHGYSWKYFEPAYKFDGSDPQYSDLYCDIHEPGEKPNEKFQNEWLAKIIEVIDNYKPDLIWFDFGIASIDEKIQKKFYSYYFNKAQEWGKEVVVTVKKGAKEKTPGEIAVLDFEHSRENRLVEYPWLTDTSLGPWFYTKSFGESQLDASKFIRLLIDIVSKNGCLLLNVPPMADGSIPENAREVLLEMGRWLKINGEAIYDTRPWLVYGEGPTEIDEERKKIIKQYLQDYTNEDFRYTSNGDYVYAFPMFSPEDKIILKSLGVKSLNKEIKVKSVKLLGVKDKVEWAQNDEALIINVNDIKHQNQLVWVFKIKIKVK
ncbi:MAG TPA: alpha-L-fucosidase [Bacteroidetes bacterium]|nr:alpha-L-fucosidase [Bacteroidota bacterium]